MLSKLTYSSLSTAPQSVRNLVKEGLFLMEDQIIVDNHTRFLSRNGWKLIGSGANRKCYIKKNVVLKIPFCWHTTSSDIRFYKKINRSDKKYFARIYAATNFLIFQEAIKIPVHKLKIYKQQLDNINIKGILTARYIAWKYHMEDIMIPGHNVGFIKPNIPKFYDFSEEPGFKNPRKDRHQFKAELCE